MKYIAIDIGSSFVKSAVLGLDTGTIAASRKFPSPPRTAGAAAGRYEVPAERYTDIVRSLVTDYAAEFPDIAGILLAAQMHGFVYCVPGRPDTYVSWQDLRCLEPMPGTAGSYMDYLAEKIPPAEMVNAGVYIKPSLGLCNLFTMLEQDPSLPRDGALHTIGSYIIARLAGGNACHLTSATPLGIADAAAGCWNRPLLEKLALGDLQLPDIADDFEVCGTIRCGGRDIPIFPDYGDQQAAVLGCLPRPGDAVINIATGAQVIVPTDTFQPGPYEIRPYFEKTYINTISNMPAGRGLDILVNFVRGAASAAAGAEISAAAVWKAVREGFVLDPQGLRADTCFYPVPEQRDGGSVSGIGPANFTLHTLFAAAYMDMARVYWDNIRILAGGPDRVERLVCSGGVPWKNPELLEAVRRTAQKETVLSPIPDETMSGLYRAALTAAGICSHLRDKPELTLTIKEPA